MKLLFTPQSHALLHSLSEIAFFPRTALQHNLSMDAHTRTHTRKHAHRHRHAHTHTHTSGQSRGPRHWAPTLGSLRPDGATGNLTLLWPQLAVPGSYPRATTQQPPHSHPPAASLGGGRATGRHLVITPCVRAARARPSSPPRPDRSSSSSARPAARPHQSSSCCSGSRPRARPRANLHPSQRPRLRPRCRPWG